VLERETLNVLSDGAEQIECSTLEVAAHWRSLGFVQSNSVLMDAQVNLV